MKGIWKLGIWWMGLASTLIAQSSASHSIAIRIRYPNFVKVQWTHDALAVQAKGNTECLFCWKSGNGSRRVTVASEGVQGKMVVGKDRIVEFREQPRELLTTHEREGSLSLKIVPESTSQATAGCVIYTITES